MVTPESIEISIAEGMATEYLNVDGDGQHFDAVVVSEAFAGAEGVFLKEVGGTEACEAIEQAGITADLGGIGDGLTEAIDDLVVSNAACFDLAGVVEIEVIDASTGESRAVVEAVSSPNGFADLAVDQHPDRVAVDSKGISVHDTAPKEWQAIIATLPGGKIPVTKRD